MEDAGLVKIFSPSLCTVPAIFVKEGILVLANA